MEFENIGGNCISVISEYIPDYISFALVSRQFRDSWVGEKESSKKLLYGSVKNGNLEMIKFYIKNGCPWDENVCSYAAHGGHLEILKWARSEGCPWDRWVCINSADKGHLEILKWARSQGCPWNKWVCILAALGGHLEILKYARSEGCPWDEYTIGF